MLIFTNGKAYFDNGAASVDVDENGFPIKGDDFTLTATCYIEVGTENKRGRNEDGAYPNASYVVSVDYDAIKGDFNPKKMRLEHDKKGDLGVFTIQRVEFYDLMRTIQIWT